MYRNAINRLFLLFPLILAGWFASCEREDISTNPSLMLKFSTDTVMFDTVFTTIGSSTRYFKVYNRNKHDLRISSIQLAGSSSSSYQINIDGSATDRVEDITIRRNDSLFVFVEVTIDPKNQNSPIEVDDSVIFTTNGNVQDVKLVAWGQDIHLLKADTIESSTTFIADKPYLVYNSLYIKPNVELNISPGSKIYFHNNAHLLVDGTLTVNGDFENPVTFESDRRESFYRDKAGQWGGIWLHAGSKHNVIKWAEIRNAINGIVVDSCVTADAPTLRINNSKVEIMSSIGLYARGSKIEADNCLFSNAGQSSVALTKGGYYRFYHCTIVNYWDQYTYRNGATLFLSNNPYNRDANSSFTDEPRELEAFFYNSIIYGSRDQELGVDNLGSTVSSLMNYIFDHCILKVPSSFDLSNHTRFNNVSSDYPNFKSILNFNFELDTLSPAKDKGLIDYALPYPVDLKNYSHILDSKPDLGAYERKE